jgi:chemotaxis regulatin CheY-phosphate phosphatase CheZ
MKREELDTLQHKVDELRAVLIFGKRAIPFLEDIFAFVQEIIPVVEEMKASVDATAEKLPKASKQLDKVTHATELASTEILNTLETMFGKLEEMTTRYNERLQRSALLAETATALDAALTGDSAGPAVREAWARHKAALSSPDDATLTILDGLKNDCTSIMIALQVQDITAQQIAAVNRLMQSVDEGFMRLMNHFSQVPHNADPDRFNHEHLDITFDVAAEYVGVEDRQKAADALVETVKQSQSDPHNGQ